MGFFDKLFGKKDKAEDKAATVGFDEGDIFYTFSDGKYHLYKLLKHDQVYGTYHVLCYEETATLPEPDSVKDMKVIVYHTPIAADGFTEPRLLVKSKISNDDMMGYMEYLRQMGDDAIVVAADGYYKEAYKFTDMGRHEEAIIKYGLAAELVPEFFEAIDNKAFCYMDLGQWDAAIKDFEQSLSVNPDGFAAIFSIGECYMRLEKYAEAKVYLERAQTIDPSNKHTGPFLKKIEELMK